MSTGIQLRLLRDSDIPGALNFVETAGWNQLRADWLRLLAHDPEGCFAAERDGSLAGTVTTTVHDGLLGWIGMLLVSPDHRRQGIGTRLLLRALECLEAQAIGCIKLDATPEGKAVYDQHGFHTECRLFRWEKEVRENEASAPPEPPPPGLRNLTNDDLEKTSALDETAFGADRSRCLRLLLRDGIDARLLIDEGTPKAVGWLRPGRIASYLGPVSAAAPDFARQLILSLLAGWRQSRIFWDIPDDNAPALELAESLGFTRGRTLIRMYRGKNIAPTNTTQTWAIASPETG